MLAPEHTQPDATFVRSFVPEPTVEEGKGQPVSEGCQQQGEVSEDEDHQGDEGGEEGSTKRQREADWEKLESKWEAGGWLKDNPLDVPTEREFYVQQKQLPVYRVMLTKR